MIRLRITALAAVLAAAASLTVATAVPASAEVTGLGFGSGPTEQAATTAAVAYLHDDYGGCGPYVVVSAVDNGGTWMVEVDANCQAPH